MDGQGIEWANVIVTTIGSASGVGVGALVTAYKQGRWKQKIEDTLESHEKRLNNGAVDIKTVPVIEAKLDILTADLKAFAVNAVTRGECRARHEVRDAKGIR